MDNTVYIEDYFSVYFHDFLFQDEGPICHEWAERDPRNLYAKALHNLRMKEPDNVLDLFREAAEGGHAQAAYGMGLCLVMIARNDQNPDTYAEAAIWFSYAADLGLEEAMLALAFMHLAEDCPLRNHEHAAICFRRAAEAGNAEGMYEYGNCFLAGQGVEQNFDQSAYWFEKAAVKGNTLAQFELGIQYCHGEGVQKDIARALHLFEQAAESEHPGAMAALAQFYYDGEGVEQDFGKAYMLFFKSYMSGNPKGNLGLAHFYLDNLAMPADFQTTLRLLSADNAAQHPPARQLRENLLKFLIEGAENGDAAIEVQLGWAVLNEYAYDGDKSKAFSLISAAAGKGDLLARCLLRCYFPEVTTPVTADTEECIAFFREQTEHGASWAARELLLMALRKDYAATDKEIAILYQKGHELGDLLLREQAFQHMQDEQNEQN